MQQYALQNNKSLLLFVLLIFLSIFSHFYAYFVAENDNAVAAVATCVFGRVGLSHLTSGREILGSKLVVDNFMLIKIQEGISFANMNTDWHFLP